MHILTIFTSAKINETSTFGPDDGEDILFDDNADDEDEEVDDIDGVSVNSTTVNILGIFYSVTFHHALYFLASSHTVESGSVLNFLSCRTVKCVLVPQ